MFVCAQVLQPCMTFCDPMACGPPDSTVPGVPQGRILKWVAMPYSKGSSQPKDQTHISASPALQAESLPLSHREARSKTLIFNTCSSCDHI